MIASIVVLLTASGPLHRQKRDVPHGPGSDWDESWHRMSSEGMTTQGRVRPIEILPNRLRLEAR